MILIILVFTLNALEYANDPVKRAIMIPIKSITNINIYGIILAAVIVLAGSCTKEPDMSKVDNWLGEYYNQELLWNLDSLAFHRAEWTSQTVTDGVQIRKTQVKMMGLNRSISYLSYSPDEFKTYIGYSEQGGTVADVAAAQNGALFAMRISLICHQRTPFFPSMPLEDARVWATL